MRRMTRLRGLRLEQLEDRLPLAGNVTASVIGGNLRIIGDNAGHDLSVSQVDLTTYAIIPNDDTSINGGPAGLGIDVTGVTGNVNISLGNGINGLGFQTTELFGNLTINGGNGVEIFPGAIVSDSIVVGGLVRGQVRINLRDGDDSLRLLSLSAGRSVTITGGTGGKETELNSCVFDQSLVLAYSGATGNITLTANTVLGGTVISTSGSGVNSVTVDGGSYQGGFGVNLGGGDDFLRFSDASGPLSFGGPVVVYGGCGTDQLDGASLLPSGAYIFSFETINP